MKSLFKYHYMVIVQGEHHDEGDQSLSKLIDGLVDGCLRHVVPNFLQLQIAKTLKHAFLYAEVYGVWQDRFILESTLLVRSQGIEAFSR